MMKGTLAFLVVVLLSVSAAGVLLGYRAPAQPFALVVSPLSINGDAIAGQRVVFLVAVSSNEPGQVHDVKVSAAAPQSAVTVSPTTLSEGEVGEVAVIPEAEAVGTNVTVLVRAEGPGSVQLRQVSFSVVEGEDYRLDHARELRGLFVQWLQTNAASLGIDNSTQWMGTIVSPQWLIVEHYLFFSKDWEMHVYWHVMIPPYDWAKIDLRERGTGLAPSLSFEISSVSAGATPHEIAPPDQAWR